MILNKDQVDNSKPAGLVDISVGLVKEHERRTKGVHGAGTGTIATVGDIATDGNLSAAAQDAVTKRHTQNTDTALDSAFLTKLFSAITYGDLLTNGSFEVSDPPTSWTLFGAGATVARSTTQVKVGTYSAALTRSGTDCAIFQAIAGSNKTLISGAWIYCSSANVACIDIRDDSGLSTQVFNTTTGWQFLTVTKAITTNAKVELWVIGTNLTAYFDGAVLFESI